MMVKPRAAILARSAVLNTLTGVGSPGARILSSVQPSYPAFFRFAIVGGRSLSRRPVIKNTATFFDLAKLNSFSVGSIALASCSVSHALNQHGSDGTLSP